jgi:hypothetical protein
MYNITARKSIRGWYNVWVCTENPGNRGKRAPVALRRRCARPGVYCTYSACSSALQHCTRQSASSSASSCRNLRRARGQRSTGKRPSCRTRPVAQSPSASGKLAASASTRSHRQRPRGPPTSAHKRRARSARSGARSPHLRVASRSLRARWAESGAGRRPRPSPRIRPRAAHTDSPQPQHRGRPASPTASHLTLPPVVCLCFECRPRRHARLSCTQPSLAARKPLPAHCAAAAELRERRCSTEEKESGR